MKRVLSSILILLHLALVIAPDAIASLNYKIDKHTFSSGGSGKSSSTTYRLSPDILGSPLYNNGSAASYKLNIGFIYHILSNPPEFKATIPNKQWNENEKLLNAFDLDDYFSTDNPPLKYIYSQTTKDPNKSPKVLITIDPSTNIVSFSQPTAYYGTEYVTYRATDTEGNYTDSNEVQLTVIGTDNPPVIDPISDITLNENEPAIIKVKATDLDDDDITFSYSDSRFIVTKPPYKENNSWYSETKWQTDYDSSGTYKLKVTATDNSSLKLSSSRDVNITVKNVNRAPYFEIPAFTLSPTSPKETDVIILSPKAKDPDNNPITFYYQAPTDPLYTIYQTAAFDQTGKWLTTYTDSGVYAVKIIGSDGIDTISTHTKFTVTNTNRPPIPTLTVSRNTLNPNDTLTILLSAIDPDNDPMTYKIDIDTKELKSGQLTTPITTTTSFPTPGDYIIKATVTDTNPDPKTVSTQTTINIRNPVSPDKLIPAIGDFNADGLTDLGIHYLDNGKWDIGISTEGKFTSTTNWLNNFGTTAEQITITGDFNADAYQDIGIYNITTGDCSIALNNKNNTFTDKGIWIKFTEPSYDWTPLTADFNNDGSTDLAVYNPRKGELRTALSDGTKFTPFTSQLTNFTDSSDYQPMLIDVNADSLPDLIAFNKSTGQWKVSLYAGNRFIDTGIWIDNFAKDKQPLISDFNYDGITDIGYYDKDTSTIKYAISNTTKFTTQSTFKTNLPTDKGDSLFIADFDGNGLQDISFFDKTKLGIECWYVLLSTDKPKDLLTNINNGTGGFVQIEYTYLNERDKTLLPFPLYVTSQITAVDTLPSDKPIESYRQEITYTGGYFDPQEREFRGFQTATVKDPLTLNYTTTYFHQGIQGEDGSLKGRTKKIESYDGNSKLISRTQNNWQVRKGGPLASGIGFPCLVSTTNTVNEENNTSVTTEDLFIYDDLGNPTETTTKGDLSKTQDERFTRTTYNLPYQISHNTPKEVQLLNEKQQIINKSSFEYDKSGNLTKQTVYINGTASDPSTTYTYDTYGNVLTQTDGLGRTTQTLYDDVVQAYPVKTTNPLGHTSRTTYDYRFGIALSITDANNNTSSYTYDSYTRLVQQKNPNNDIIAEYEYPDFNTKITKSAGFTSKEYIDGLQRRYLTKTQGEDGTSLRWVTTEAYFNQRGLTEAESLSHYENETPQNITYTRYEYDIRGRIKRTITDFSPSILPTEPISKLPNSPKDTISQIEYLTPLSFRTTDPKGNRKDTIKDVYGRTIEIIENTSDGIYHTYYEYDIKDNLTKLTDSKNNTTTITYDTLSRKTSMTDPDMGLWRYEYDKLGNLTKQTDAKNQVILFEYDKLNRLTKKWGLSPILGTVPIFSVEYLYDDPSKSNCISRLSKVTYPSGQAEFFYDKLGREVKSIKEISQLPSFPATQYKIEREYDLLNRLTKLTYPDGEAVSYSYDVNSGLLESVSSSLRAAEGGEAISYVKNITYNASGQITTINYGNNVTTTYTYGQDLRLSNMLTKNPSQTTLQNLYYDFDKNGNLTSLTDNITSKTRTYEYDDLDRLTKAINIPTPDNFGTTQNFKYDSIGNITYKSDVGDYIYGQNAGPHAVTQAGGINYFYDANGNLTKGRNKTLEYDTENRLTKVTEGTLTTSFAYDGDGGRVMKTTYGVAEGIPVGWVGSTIYIGSLYETETRIATNGDRITTNTKHLFAGANRIASITLSPVGGEGKGEGVKVSYYHSDHLGSANILTDKDGIQTAHYEYLPYGQTSIADIKPGSSGTNYKFTGKEQDASTGLYFYAWRYYDPLLGRYTQPDTIIPSPTNPQSFNRYSYCDDNPINYTDPTGHRKFRDFIKRYGDYFSPFGRAVATGEWKHFGIVVATMAANMLLPGAGTLSSNFLLNVGLHAARGAAIGAVTGGISAEIMGGDFRDGARLGAISGGISGSIQGITSSEQFGNFMGGNGFRSNNDVKAQQVRIANMRASLGMSRETMMSAARSAQAAENGVAGQIGGDLTPSWWQRISLDVGYTVGIPRAWTSPLSGGINAGLALNYKGVYAYGGIGIAGGGGASVTLCYGSVIAEGISQTVTARTGNGLLGVYFSKAIDSTEGHIGIGWGDGGGGGVSMDYAKEMYVWPWARD